MLTICVGMGYTSMRELSDRIIEAQDTQYSVSHNTRHTCTRTRNRSRAGWKGNSIFSDHITWTKMPVGFKIQRQTNLRWSSGRSYGRSYDRDVDDGGSGGRSSYGSFLHSSSLFSLVQLFLAMKIHYSTILDWGYHWTIKFKFYSVFLAPCAVGEILLSQG